MAEENINNTNRLYNLIFCRNGSFFITREPMTEDGLFSCTFDGTSSEQYVLQCYSNGNINKVSTSELLSLRENFEYSHAVYSGTTMQSCLVLNEDDHIVAKYVRNKKEFNKVFSVASILPHSILGLKGRSVINYTDITNLTWSPSNSTDALQETNLEEDSGEEIEVTAAESKAYHKEQDTNFKVQEVKLIHNKDEENIDEDVFTLINREEWAKVSQVFKGFTTIGRMVPQGQSLARKVIADCDSSYMLWNLISVLLDCETNIYRKPIADTLNEQKDLQGLKPNLDMFEDLTKHLFNFDDKYVQSLAIVFPYRDCLSKASKDLIRNKVNNLAHPDDYKRLISILGMNSDEAIHFLFNEDTPAAYYRVYEMLHERKILGAKDLAEKMATRLMKSFDAVSSSAFLIKEIIVHEFCGKKQSVQTRNKVKKIINEGFEEYLRICRREESMSEMRERQKNINQYIGKQMSFKIIEVYRNHYLLGAPSGLTTLLPRNCCWREYEKYDEVSVTIVHADVKHHVLFSSQKLLNKRNDVLASPLQDIGDMIEVRFSNPVALFPTVQKCFNKLNVKVVERPIDFNYKYKYKAKVVGRRGFFDYDIALTEPVK